MDNKIAPDKAALKMLIEGMRKMELDSLTGFKDGEKKVEIDKSDAGAEAPKPEPEIEEADEAIEDDESAEGEDEAPVVDEKEAKRKALMAKLGLK